MTISLTSLFTTETAEELLARLFTVAESAGLVPTSWRDGDPTLTVFGFVAESTATIDTVVTSYLKAGFLSTSVGDWKTLVADEIYGVERVEATYATSTITLANAGGGLYPFEVGALTVRSSTSSKTYHNTAAVTVNPGATITVDVVADEAGSDSSAGVDEIDELVTTALGVTVTASTAAVGEDEQSDASLEEQCNATLGALSPNGPADAYEYVVRNHELTGDLTITRAATAGDSATGAVTVYTATATGAPSGGAVTLAQEAVNVWAEPLTITATVVAATEQAVAVTASFSADDTPTDAEAELEAEVTALFAGVEIGGVVARSAIIAAIHAWLVEAGASRVTVTLAAPAADVDVPAGYVATAGVIAVTEV